MAFVEKMMPAPNPSRDGESEFGRRFDFPADTFAFANELVWEYRLDPATRQMTFHRRDPKPAYAHRCFVLVRSVRQFFFHARFDPAQSPLSAAEYRQLIRMVVRQNPRQPGHPKERVVIPGFANVRALSQAHPEWFKEECGGAWQSYILRSHWRMVFPISRRHQAKTAAALAARVQSHAAPIVHLVKFPSLTINHGMVLYGVAETAKGFQFAAYDPNDPSQPVQLTFDAARRTFYLPANSYWAGGELKVIEIYRDWVM